MEENGGDIVLDGDAVWCCNGSYRHKEWCTWTPWVMWSTDFVEEAAAYEMRLYNAGGSMGM